MRTPGEQLLAQQFTDRCRVAAQPLGGGAHGHRPFVAFRREGEAKGHHTRIAMTTCSRLGSAGSVKTITR